ncbi:MAG: hypothetical protein ACRDBP_18915 [Luteolibacter sp.]
MKTYFFKVAAALLFILVVNINAQESQLSLSLELVNGNQLSQIEKFDGVDYNIHIDGKFSVDDKSKFIVSEVSVLILSQEEANWKNSLKSKFQVNLPKHKSEVVLTGSQSNFIKYDGWSVAATHTAKYDENTKNHVVSFWIFLVRGELDGPEKLKEFVPFPEKEGSKIIEIGKHKSLAVFLGNVTTK